MCSDYAAQMEPAEIAQRIRELREEAGLSQHALARAAGIDPTNLNRIERGRQGAPRQATMLRIIRGLGLPFADERVQQLLRVTAGVGGQPADRAVHDEALSYRASLAPTIRELRTTLFRALELVS